MENSKRRLNEKKYETWTEIKTGRIYRKSITGKFGWKAEYVKTVNKQEETILFIQNIYNEKGKLVEIHEKFPIDKGHKKI
jgi:hypothetical protein